MPSTLRSLSSGTFIGPGSFGRSGGRLRKRCGHGGVERNVPFHLLHDLMNVAVQNRY